MRLVLPVTIFLAFCLCIAPARANSCRDFALQVSLASHALVDFRAYPDSSSEQAKASYNAFSHFMDVAKEYSDDCPLEGSHALYREYYRLDWWKSEDEYNGNQADRQLQKSLAQVEGSILTLLYGLGFAAEHKAEYSVMKQATMQHYAELGLAFKSPETGKVLVKRNGAKVNCELRDHDPDFSALTLAAPRSASRLTGTFSIMVELDEQGRVTYSTANYDQFVDLSDSGLMESAMTAAQDIEQELRDARFGPRVSNCRPVASALMFKAKVDPSSPTLLLQKQ